jgi:hypothetical protein
MVLLANKSPDPTQESQVQSQGRRNRLLQLPLSRLRRHPRQKHLPPEFSRQPPLQEEALSCHLRRRLLGILSASLAKKLSREGPISYDTVRCLLLIF